MVQNRSAVITLVVLLALIGYLAVTLSGLVGKLNAAQEEQTVLEERVAEKGAENDRLSYAVRHSDEDEVIAQVAREELGYVYPDETVFTPAN